MTHLTQKGKKNLSEKRQSDKHFIELQTQALSAQFPSLFHIFLHTFIHGFLSPAVDLPEEAVPTTS